MKQYQEQKSHELRELELKQKEEAAKRELIEKEKEKLIREHESLLKNYFAKGYQKSVSSLTSSLGSFNIK